MSVTYGSTPQIFITYEELLVKCARRGYMEVCTPALARVMVPFGPFLLICEIKDPINRTDWDGRKALEFFEYSPPRQADDGSYSVRVDPATADTDPNKRDEDHKHASAASVSYPLTGAPAGFRFEGIIVQVKDAVPGDKMTVVLTSDGVDPLKYGPIGTTLKSFGTMNAPMPSSSAGWGERLVKSQTSKVIPPGTRLEFVYKAIDGNVRELLIDWYTQE